MGQSNNTLGVAKQSKSASGRIIGALIGCGVALGLWRYMGDGASIWDPGWVSNAFQNMQDAIAAVPDLVHRLTDNIVNNPNKSRGQ